MDLHLRNIGSREKSTAEGMTLPYSSLIDAAQQAVGKSGGSPDDCQVLIAQDAEGLDRIVIAIHPRLRDIVEADLLEAIRSRLLAMSGGAKLAVELWGSVGTLRIVRECPRPTTGGKQLPVIVLPDRAGDAVESNASLNPPGGANR